MKRHIFILSVLLFVSAFCNIIVANTHTAEGEPYVMISVLKIDEAKIDDAIDLLSDLQLMTLESEEGCLIFDVLLSDEDPTKAFIYESYLSEDAYNKHMKSKHYSDVYLKKLSPMIKEANITKVFMLNFEGGYPEDVM